MSGNGKLIVSDTGPLITFLKINKLQLLEKIFQEIRIPPAVYDELTKNTKFPLEKIQIDNAKYIIVDNEFDKTKISSFQERIHRGEAEAIALVQTINEKDPSNSTRLLADDADAARFARESKIPVIGAIGVLQEAIHANLLTDDEVEESISIMKATHRYYSDEDYQVLTDALTERNKKRSLDAQSVLEEFVKQESAYIDEVDWKRIYEALKQKYIELQKHYQKLQKEYQKITEKEAQQEGKGKVVSDEQSI